jgi:hypothetical protein
MAMIAAISTNDRISARTIPARHIVPLRIYPPTHLRAAVRLCQIANRLCGAVATLVLTSAWR